MSRPSTDTIEKYNIIDQFKRYRYIFGFKLFSLISVFGRLHLLVFAEIKFLKDIF